MKIYTRRGDGGETDLFGSGRVPKDHLRVEAYGAVDEVNATLGLCAATTPEAELREFVQSLQCGLFELGSYLATPEARHRDAMGMHEPSAAVITALEARIDAFEAELPPLERFVLPGGTQSAANDLQLPYALVGLGSSEPIARAAPRSSQRPIECSQSGRGVLPGKACRLPTRVPTQRRRQAQRVVAPLRLVQSQPDPAHRDLEELSYALRGRHAEWCCLVERLD